MEAGREDDIRPIAPCEARRIEAGIFNYRSDMTLDNNPFEVTGFERLVEDQEGDYIGKQALERIRAEGVSRKLVGMEIEGDPLDWELTQFWPARPQRRPGRPRDDRDPLAAPREEHRLRVGADRAGRAGHGARAGAPRRHPPRGADRRAPVRRPAQEDSRRLSPTVLGVTPDSGRYPRDAHSAWRANRRLTYAGLL